MFDLTAKQRNFLASAMKLSPEDLAELKVLSRREKQRGTQKKCGNLTVDPGIAWPILRVVLCVCMTRGVSYVWSLVVCQNSLVHAVVTGLVASGFLFTCLFACYVCVCVCV